MNPPAIVPRCGLPIIDIGAHAELRDHAGHLRSAHGFAAGDITLLRPTATSPPSRTTSTVPRWLLILVALP